MTVPENIVALDAAVVVKQAEVDLLTGSATNFRSFQAAYVSWAAKLSAKTGTTVSPTYNSITAAIDSLPDA